MFGTYSTNDDIYTNPLFPRTSAYLDAMLASRRACMGLLHDSLVSVWHGSPYPVSVPAACALAFYLDLSD